MQIKCEFYADNIIIIFLVFGLILPSFSFAQVSPPGTLKEIKLNFGGILKKIWKEEVLPVWQKIWGKITTPFKKEFERRKPIIEEEFQKEKQEMKEEIKTELPKTGKSLWQKFKELIK